MSQVSQMLVRFPAGTTQVAVAQIASQLKAKIVHTDVDMYDGPFHILEVSDEAHAKVVLEEGFPGVIIYENTQFEIFQP